MFFSQVRHNTVECLREIADYMDEISRKAGVAKVKFKKKNTKTKLFSRLSAREEECLRGGSLWLEGCWLLYTSLFCHNFFVLF